MRIPSGKIDQTLAFVAQLAGSRVTGLTGFTVYRSRNGGAATAYTTPTVAELSAANMPGVYVLTVDEDTTIAAASDSEEMVLHITATGMDPVTRVVELYRRDTTSGQTLDVVATGAALATLQSGVDDLPTNAELAVALAGADDAVLAQLALVRAKTDGLSFTIAGQVDANIQSVNDIEVTGTGASGSEWGPA